LGLPRLITVSHCITRDPIKGHPYWFHKCLDEAAKGSGLTHITCGPKDQASRRIQGVLEHPGHFRSVASIFVFWGRKNEISELEEILSEGSYENFIHIYEGGFREFILIRRLAWRNPDLNILFNFNLTDPWHLVIDKKTVSAWLARRVLRRAVLELGTQLAPFAETKETAGRFSKVLGIKFSQYPLFSTVNAPDNIQNNKQRKFDVTCFPATAIELSEVMSAIEKLSNDILPKILIVPRWGLKLSPSDIQNLRSIGIEFVEKVLNAQEYRALYAATKVAVFPYEDLNYLNTSSGRLLDAAAAGCYAIAPKSSSPGRQIEREGWGSSYTDMSTEITIGLKGWNSFKVKNVPNVDNSLRHLIKKNQLLTTKANSNVKRRTYTPDILLFAFLMLGTGFRSWAPRLIQALDMLVKSRLIKRSLGTAI
jgi:hypothetical protein